MKIGFLLYDFFPFGGLERDCLRIAEICAERGHQVSIWARSWQGERPENITLRIFGRQGLTNTGRNHHWLKQLAAALPAEKFDCIVGFNKLPHIDVYYAADLCFAAKLPDKPLWSRWLPRARQILALEHGVFDRDAKTEILLLTARDIATYQQFYRTPAERFHVLPPNARRRDISRDQRADTRRRIRETNRWSPDENLLLFVGSDFHRKGLDRAIRAFAALDATHRNQTQLAVLGQDKPEAFVRLARELGVDARVHFFGGRTDAPDWMVAADVMVHPARRENTGTVIVEALASGLPVLVTEICGYANHVKSANAGRVLSEPFSQEDFNRALHAALDAATLAQWRANAAAYAATGAIFGCHERAAEIIEAIASRSIKVS